MTCDSFTNQELDQLYDLVRDKHDDVMRGDWEAVKPDIADLHLLMSKLIYAQRNPMTNYPFEEIEQKEFNLKFSFEMLTSTIMFIQKVKSLYPGENNPVNINCTNLEDEIVDQLIEEDLDSLNSYFKRINLDKQLDNS